MEDSGKGRAGSPGRVALLIAYHFPPVLASSGLQRTVSNAKYLPDYGWRAVVLTAQQRAYRAVSNGQMDDIADMEVHRALAFDAARHFAVKGRYPRFFALPDPWSSWWFGAVLKGLRLVRSLKPRVLWSTYPIATAHLIGYTLHKLTGVPWVADFRDPMTDADYPTDPLTRKLYHRIERLAMNNASLCVFTTEASRREYLRRFGNESADRFLTIPNGFDEVLFREVEDRARSCRKVGEADGAQGEKPPLLLLHSGVVYPSERDPTALLDAIAALEESGAFAKRPARIRFRASGNDDALRDMIAARRIGHRVELAPSLPYREAIAEYFDADALLVLQGESCSQQVPAKLYEYARAGKPVIVLADPSSETARIARDIGIQKSVALEDSGGIRSLIEEWLILEGCNESGFVAKLDAVKECSREKRVRTLAQGFEEVAGGNWGP